MLSHCHCQQSKCESICYSSFVGFFLPMIVNLCKGHMWLGWPLAWKLSAVFDCGIAAPPWCSPVGGVYPPLGTPHGPINLMVRDLICSIGFITASRPNDLSCDSFIAFSSFLLHKKKGKGNNRKTLKIFFGRTMLWFNSENGIFIWNWLVMMAYARNQRGSASHGAVQWKDGKTVEGWCSFRWVRRQCKNTMKSLQYVSQNASLKWLSVPGWIIPFRILVCQIELC